MTDTAWATTALVLAGVPAALFCWNLCLYRRPKWTEDASVPRVSILVPARNEEAGIAASVRAALASQGVDHEVVVLDDHSQDATARIVSEIAAENPRVRLETAPPLPAGWCGKQHACAALAGLARHDILVFLDADVRLEPDGVARAVGFLETSGAALVSGVPRQETGTFWERLLIPLIHFVLLGFLPVWRMRRCTKPAYSAGCGQLFVTTKTAYQQSGGHAAIRQSLHDGVKLPRAYRLAGVRTDLFDATDTASCRMYRSGGETWRGLQKNAVEGLAAPGMILVTTAFLAGGQLLPFGLTIAGFFDALSPEAWRLAGIACGLALLPRVAAAVRFRQSWWGVVLHPLGVAVLLAIQWSALMRWLVGSPSAWKGRTYG